MICGHKKNRAMPGFFDIYWCSSAGVGGGVGETCLGRLEITQSFTHDLLGNTGTFTTLGADASCGAYFPITAAAFINRITNMTVGNTLAKTDVHMNYPLRLFDVGDAKQNENDCQSILSGACSGAGDG